MEGSVVRDTIKTKKNHSRTFSYAHLQLNCSYLYFELGKKLGFSTDNGHIN